MLNCNFFNYAKFVPLVDTPAKENEAGLILHDFHLPPHCMLDLGSISAGLRITRLPGEFLLTGFRKNY